MEQKKLRENSIRRYLNRKEFIEIIYSEKYLNIKVLFKDNLLGEFSGLDSFKNGQSFLIDGNRTVNIKFNTDPFEFTTTVNKVYIPNTLHHPKRKLSSLNSLYSIIMGISILGLILSVLSFNFIEIFLNVLNIILLAMMLYGISFGNKYYFYPGFIFFVINTVLVLGLAKSDQATLIIIPVFLIRLLAILFTLKKIKFLEEYNSYRIMLKEDKNSSILF